MTRTCGARPLPALARRLDSLPAGASFTSWRSPGGPRRGRVADPASGPGGTAVVQLEAPDSRQTWPGGAVVEVAES